MVDGLSLDGLVSGFPTSDVIEQLMAIERRPIVNLQQQKSDLEVIKDTWRDINTRLANLESKLTTLKLSSTYDSNKTTSSNKDVATATATSDASLTSYELNVTQLAKAHRIASDNVQTITGNPDADSTTELNLSGTVNINGKDVTIEITDSLTDIQDKINNTEDIGINASIINDTLVLEANETGVANEIQLVDDNNVLLNLGLIDSGGSIKNLQDAKDAELTINGISVTSDSNTIENVVNGVTFTLHDTGTATIDVSRDIDKTVTAIQAFVDQYNSVMSFISEKTDYDPETKRAGTLQGDSTLMRIEMNLRRYIMDSVDTESDYNQLAMIGISIDKDGVMSFDSSKLEEALVEAPVDIMKLFIADTDDGDSFDGVAIRLDNYLDMLLQTNTGLIPEKVDMYETMINDIDEQIESMEERLTLREEQLRNEFTAMEKALSEMQSQGNWLMMQIASLGSVSLLS